MSSDKYHQKRYGGPGHRWTDEELDWMAEHVPGTDRQECMAMFAERFGWTPTLPSWNNVCVKHGFKAGVSHTRFVKGQSGHNKGKKWHEYLSDESQQAIMDNSALNSRLPMYGISIQRHQVNIKVPIEVVELFERTPIKGKDYGFIAYNRYVWWQETGKLPGKDEVVTHKDFDWKNNDISNLDIVPRPVYTRMLFDRWTAETYEAVKAMALLDEEARNAKQACQMCGQRFRPKWKTQMYCPDCIESGAYRKHVSDKATATKMMRRSNQHG